jgi:hypothetical protein
LLLDWQIDMLVRFLFMLYLEETFMLVFLLVSGWRRDGKEVGVGGRGLLG